MTIHKLKIDASNLVDLLSGKKTAEVVMDDRNYVVDDVLELQSLNIDFYHLSSFKIMHIHKGNGIADGFVMLSILDSSKG